MKKIVFLVALLLVSISSPVTPYVSPAYAADGGETDPILDPDTGASSPTTCDYEEIKKSLNQTEGCGKDCMFKGAGSSKYGPARGKYQFIADTWNRMAKGCPNANQCPHSQVGYNPACCSTQECAMNNLLSANQNYLSTSTCKGKQCKEAKYCEDLLGKTVYTKNAGKKWCGGKVTPASCTVTKSGLLAAMHLGGVDVCSGITANGHGDSDGHTYEVDYVCTHAGLPVPDDCTPAPFDPDQAPPIGTDYQIKIRIGQGEPVVIGGAEGIKENWVAGLMLMARQLTANMIMQVEMIGQLFDAKHQLETQRLFQEKMSEAHKDYQVSEQMCTFGTFARDLVATERSANLSRSAVSKHLIQRELGEGESVAMSLGSDSLSRLAKFREKFCNPDDNGKGLKLLCPKAAPVETQNADINYTQSIDQPLSLEINMKDTDVTPDEEVVFALVDNLFAHDPPPRLPPDAMDQQKYQYHYMNLRSLVAMRGIARNSIANIIALKTATPNEDANGASAAPYLKALFREFGLPDEEIKKLLGERPSYYAQMELLTKKIYQHPSFYTNLYDKPANVERIRTAMRAVKLMQDRDIQASLQRREMLLSMMLEIRLRERAEAVYNAAERAMFEAQ